MATTNSVKCACDNCHCLVSLSDAVMKNDKPYCSDACAQGHPEGSGCGHTGCNCG